jgi:hypothetical protein
MPPPKRFRLIDIWKQDAQLIEPSPTYFGP